MKEFSNKFKVTTHGGVTIIGTTVNLPADHMRAIAEMIKRLETIDLREKINNEQFKDIAKTCTFLRKLCRGIKPDKDVFDELFVPGAIEESA